MASPDHPRKVGENTHGQTRGSAGWRSGDVLSYTQGEARAACKKNQFHKRMTIDFIAVVNGAVAGWAVWTVFLAH